MRVLITFFVYLFGVSSVFAQVSSELRMEEGEVNFEVVEFTGGPSNVGIQEVYQDSIGYLWLSSIEGLWRWDGHHFKNYRHDPLDSTTVSNDHIERLLFDSQGKIWVGTNRGGLNLFDPQTETFQRFPYGANNPEGTSHYLIRGMLEDSDGNIWIGSANGLNRFDRESMRFTHFFHDPSDSSSIGGDHARAIHEDKEGRLWVTAYLENSAPNFNGILNLYNPEDETFTRFKHDPNDSTIALRNTGFLLEDKAGRFWMSARNVMYLLDREKGTFLPFPYEPTASQNLSFPGPEPISSMMEDQSGNIWIASLNQGLHMYNPTTGIVKDYKVAPLNPTNSISDNRILRISQAKDGTIWLGGGSIGTLKRIRSGSQTFKEYTLDELSPETNRINSYLYDRDGQIWFATNGSGLVQYDLEKGIQQQFLQDPNDPYSIQEDIVRVLFEDSHGDIWIALGGAHSIEVDRLNSRTGELEHILKDIPWVDKEKLLIKVNPIRVLEEDMNGHIWATTFGHGLLRIDRETGEHTFLTHNPEEENSLGGDEVWILLKNEDGQFWISGYNNEKGQPFLDLFDPMNEVFSHIDLGKLSMGKDKIRSIIVAMTLDHRDHLWFNLGERGLAELNPANGKITYHGEIRNELPKNRIMSIFHTGEGHLWMIESPKGLLGHYNIETETFHYVSEDQFNVSNSNAIYQSSKGDLFISTDHGFKVLDADFISPQMMEDSKVILTDFLVNGKRKLTTAIAGNATGKLGQIPLTFEENSFEFHFSTLNFDNPPNVSYAYQLEGYDSDWRRTDKEASATYLYVQPSSSPYRFRVKATNTMGEWGEPTSIEIMIYPPWWMRWWAYGLYLILAGLIIWGFLQWRTYSLRLQRQLLRTRVAEQTEELRIAKNAAEAANEAKSTFLSTVSHELRTPLTSIVGFTELIKERFEDRVVPFVQSDEKKTKRAMGQISKNLGIIKQEGERLTNLINGLLDLAKIEAGKIEWKMEQVNPAELVERATAATAALFDQKPDLQLITDIPENLPTITADRDRIIQVLINLISNAVKFTDEGHVKIRCERRESGGEKRQKQRSNTELQTEHNPQLETRNPKLQNTSSSFERGFGNEKNPGIIPLAPPSPAHLADAQGGSGELIVFMVEDTGAGIPAEYLDKVFEKFQQVEDQQSGKPKGTGLGLPICKEIVEHHDGTIWVESEEGKGSVFSFSLSSRD